MKKRKRFPGKIITVANQKGGVGKTTSVMNFGAALAAEGYRVLLIDSDPQANLTSYLGVAPERTLDELYLSKSIASLESFIIKTSSGLDLIGADRGLTGVEYYLFSRPDKEEVLKEFLNEIKIKYDFILIDTPPNLNLLTMNALVASDHVLVPVQPEFFSLEGIVKIREAVANVRNRWNETLSIIGVLPTQVNFRRKLTTEALQTLKTELKKLIFENVIHDNAAVAESSGHAQSVIDYQKKSRGAQDYLSATQEFLNRVQPKEERRKKHDEDGSKSI